MTPRYWLDRLVFQRFLRSPDGVPPPMTPEKRLCFVILYYALHDLKYQKPPNYIPSSERYDIKNHLDAKEDAIDWFFEKPKNPKYLFTLKNICEILELDIDKIRGRAKQIIQNPSLLASRIY